jgi:hypothetical protein
MVIVAVASARFTDQKMLNFCLPCQVVGFGVPQQRGDVLDAGVAF